MKKILLTSLLSLFILNAYSQIDIDKVEEDGSRIITTKSQYFNGNEKVALACLIDPNGNNTYVLLLTIDKMEISKGRKLLLKFKDDSIMELNNRKEIGPADYKYYVVLGSTIYFVFPEYPLTEEEVIKITKGEVVKIRLENNKEHIDLKVKNNKFSRKIKESHENIISEKNRKNGIYDGF